MEEVWKEAFAVGSEWDQNVNDIPWDFTNLDEAFEEGGVLHGHTVYLFGCTEPQLLQHKNQSKVIHVPAVVAVTSPFPPSEQLGIKSVQMEKEEIVPMKQMKMGWVPVISTHTLKTSLERKAKMAKIFALKCTQRRAGLKQLREERVKKYEYCLPYVYLPHMQEEEDASTVIDIMYTFEGETSPPIVTDYDWELDEMDEFTDKLVEDELLPAEDKDKFKEYLKGEIKAAKLKIREDREKRRKKLEDMSAETKEAFKNMKFYKFYPTKTEDTPDTSGVQSPYINRYYGKATQVL